MKERDDRLVLDADALAGEILLESGAEIFRVEDTIYRIAAAYGVEEAEAFVLSSGIFLTSEGEGRKTFARVKHIPLVGARLDRVSAVNQLSREIEQGLHTPEEAMARLEAIRTMPRLPARLQILASGVGSGCFCLLFGGDWADALAAAPASTGRPNVVTDQVTLAAQKGFSTLKAAVAIVLGILLVFELPQSVFRVLAGRREQ